MTPGADGGEGLPSAGFPYVYAVAGLVLLYAVHCVVSAWADSTSVKADKIPLLRTSKFPILSAHRGGASTLTPENVMLSYKRSVNEIKAHMLEIDIHKTKDGKYVIMHDKTVDRTTNGKGRVSDMTLDELQALDAAYKWSPDGGKTFPLRGKGVQIPIFDEVLDEFQGKNDLIIYFDIKDVNAVEKVFTEIEKRKLQGRVIIGATDPVINKAMLKRLPADIPCTPDTHTMYFAFFMYYLGLFSWVPIKHHILGLTVQHHGFRILSKKLVDTFHARGVKVAVFGEDLDSHDGQLLCLKCGVDILVSDRPDLLHLTYATWLKQGAKKTK